MTRVFVGGSRELTELDTAVITRLDDLMEEQYLILIGESEGVDELVQNYLFSRGYRNVIVFCTDDKCRINVGNWEVKSIPAKNGEKGFDFYAVKDLQMAKEAACGLMIWDAASSGTLNNLLNLLDMNKQSFVWFTPENTFYTIHNLQDLQVLLRKCASQDLETFEAEIRFIERLDNTQSKLAA